MSDNSPTPTPNMDHDDNRREFIRGSSLLLAAALPAAGLRSASALPSIRVGLVGCGSTGIALAGEAMRCEFADVRLVAMADMFVDRVQQAVRGLKGRFVRQFAVGDSRFVGLDGCDRLTQMDLDLVIIASPPGFRAKQLEAVVSAGQHAYVNQCVAIHRAGLELFERLGKIAEANRTCLTVGHSRLDSKNMERALSVIRSGGLGRPLEIRATARPSRGVGEQVEAGRSYPDFDSQVRNWRQVPKIAGHPMLAQQIRLVEVANGLFGGVPERVDYTSVGTASIAGVLRDAPETTFQYGHERRLRIQSQAHNAAPSWSSLEVICDGGTIDLQTNRLLSPHAQDSEGSTLGKLRCAEANEMQPSRLALTLEAIGRGQSRSDVDEAAKALAAVLAGETAVMDRLNTATA